MYLSKKTYVKNWSHQTPEETHTVTVLKGGQPHPSIKPERVSYIVEEVAYWRKFNALHGWFVKNCGNGEDDCQEMYVDPSQLKELLELLKEVKNKLDNSKIVEKVVKDWNDKDVTVEVYENSEEIEELFPPTQGFFFGSDEVDEYFKESVEETIEIITNLLEEDGDGDYYYRASW